MSEFKTDGILAASNSVRKAFRQLDRSELDELRNGLRVRYDGLRQLDDSVVRALGDDNLAAALEELVAGLSDDLEARSIVENRVNAAGYAAGFDGVHRNLRARPSAPPGTGTRRNDGWCSSQ